MDSRTDATLALQRMAAGDAAAADELLRILYHELRSLAAHFLTNEKRGATLQTTALVHEAYLKLIPNSASGFEDKQHFMRTAARAMRQVLVDRARSRLRDKRGGGAIAEPLETSMIQIENANVDMLELDEVLTKLESVDAELSRIVELRFFVGFTMEETANVLNVSVPTIERRWRVAKMWLRAQMNK
ncbi:MAG: ECF-type sigma factor [Planctomycetota bacterium]